MFSEFIPVSISNVLFIYCLMQFEPERMSTQIVARILVKVCFRFNTSDKTI